jgi:hypothetical protein
MAGISLAMAFALTGCDDILAEIQKGLGAANAAYGIVLNEFSGAEADAFDTSGTKTLLVVNTGSKATGTLKAELTGEGSEAFVLSKTELPSIEAGGSASFTVTRKADLAPGTYTATVTVSGTNNLSASFDVSFTVGDGSFEAAVEAMKANAGSASASYTLQSGNEDYKDVLTLTKGETSPGNVTIDGGGRVITGISSNVITVGDDVILTLKNITFKKIPFVVATGGHLILESGAVVSGNTAGCWNMKDGEGAISVSGALELRAGASVKDNCATGIELENNGILSMKGGTISGNKGGGGWNGGVVIFGTNGTFIMSGGLISENEGAWGAGVLMYGENGVFSLVAGTISTNKANAGGGVLLWSGTKRLFTMNGGLITGNTADADGGGVVAMPGGIFGMTGGVITGNTAATTGGGVNAWGAATFTGNPKIGGDTPPATGGWIHDNTAIQNPATNDVSQ